MCSHIGEREERLLCGHVPYQLLSLEIEDFFAVKENTILLAHALYYIILRRYWLELNMYCMLVHRSMDCPFPICSVCHVCIHNPPMRCPDAHLSLFLTRSSFHGVCVSFLHARRLDWLPPRSLFLGIGPGTQIK